MTQQQPLLCSSVLSDSVQTPGAVVCFLWHKSVCSLWIQYMSCHSVFFDRISVLCFMFSVIQISMQTHGCVLLSVFLATNRFTLSDVELCDTVQIPAVVCFPWQIPVLCLIHVLCDSNSKTNPWLCAAVCFPCHKSVCSVWIALCGTVQNPCAVVCFSWHYLCPLSHVFCDRIRIHC